MPTDRDPLNIGDGANPSPSGDPDPVTISPDLAQGETSADNDCDDSPSVQTLTPSPFDANVWQDLLTYRPDPEDHVEPVSDRAIALLLTPAERVED